MLGTGVPRAGLDGPDRIVHFDPQPIEFGWYLPISVSLRRGIMTSAHYVACDMPRAYRQVDCPSGFPSIVNPRKLEHHYPHALKVKYKGS